MMKEINQSSMGSEPYRILSEKVEEPYQAFSTLDSVDDDTIIFRVPKIMRQFRAYCPRVVTIGPFHYPREKELEIMDEYKQICTESIRDVRKLDLEVYSHRLRGLMPQVRSYYSKYATKGIEDDDELMEVLLRDSCFIMELMLAQRDAVNREQQQQQQQQVNNSWTNSILCNQQLLALVKSDVLLAENQLPYVVLETLFSLLGTKPDCSLDHLALGFFANLLTPECCNQWQIMSSSGKLGKYYNLLHLYHSCATALAPQGQPPDRPFLMPGATDLTDAGNVEFRRIEDGSCFNLSFSKGVLELSSLLLTESTIILYINLLAFEQHLFPKVDALVTTFMMILGCLVRSEKDLEVLRRKDIIGCAVTEKKAYQFFKEVNKLNSTSEISSYIPEQQLSAAVNSFVSIIRKRRIAAIKFGFFSLILTDLILAFCVIAQRNSAVARNAVLLGLLPFQMLASFLTAKNDRKGRLKNLILFHCILSTSTALSYCNVL